MTNQQQALLSISDAIGGSISMDQFWGGVAFVALIVACLTYGILHHMSRGDCSPFDSLH